MAKLNDLTGQTFGKWYVMYRNGSTANKASVWRCKCLSCGCEKDVVGQSLTSGKSTMCRKCSAKTYNATKHPNDKLKRSLFNGIRQRCYNPNHKYYKDYGGRGITICDEWLTNPDKFCDWAYANGYEDGTSIERIDVNGNYEPSNCIFIPIEEQSKNRRNVHWITIGEHTMTYSDWCRTLNLDYHNVNKTRHKYSCSPKEAILIHLAREE